MAHAYTFPVIDMLRVEGGAEDWGMFGSYGGLTGLRADTLPKRAFLVASAKLRASCMKMMAWL